MLVAGIPSKAAWSAVPNCQWSSSLIAILASWPRLGAVLTRLSNDVSITSRENVVERCCLPSERRDSLRRKHLTPRTRSIVTICCPTKPTTAKSGAHVRYISNYPTLKMPVRRVCGIFFTIILLSHSVRHQWMQTGASISDTSFASKPTLIMNRAFNNSPATIRIATAYPKVIVTLRAGSW